jgi:hypothetical protein
VKLANVFLPRNATWLLIAGTTFLYVLPPLALNFLFLEDPYFLQLGILGAVAVGGLLVGARVVNRKAPESRFVVSRKGRSSNDQFVVASFSVFVPVYLIMAATADSIPILSAIMGSDPEQLSEGRGGFLKQRTGLLAVAAYVFAVFSSSIVPFCVVWFFERRSRFRYIAAAFFLWVCISILVKAMFLNLILPLLAYGAMRQTISNKTLLKMIGAIVIGLIIMASLAGFNRSEESTQTRDITNYVSTAYAANSALDFLVWRSAIIPIIGARDTLEVHDSDLGGVWLAGATSGLIATITGRERVDLERMVFAKQYGGWNDIGNSNVTLVVDAYVNFGIVGVFLYGMLAAVIIGFLANSGSMAMGATTLLFAFYLLSASLIGVMLSNGFLLLLMWSVFQRIRIKKLRSKSAFSIQPFANQTH